MRKRVIVSFRIDEDSREHVFLGRLIVREIEVAITKAFKKVVDQKTIDELEKLNLPVPSFTMVEEQEESFPEVTIRLDDPTPAP